MNISVPISIGELIDRITILQIKKNKIKDNIKLYNINKELVLLQEIKNNLSINQEYMYILYEINNALWNIEDRIRELETKKQFDTIFIETARQVYILNDRRAQIKKEINMKYNSDIIEEKSYFKEE